MQTLLLLSWFLVATLPALSADWSHWRGPAFNGSSPETNLPTTFSASNQVKWLVPMPGPSAATPIVHGRHVFVSSTDERNRSLLAFALDRQSGKELWRHEVAPGFARDNRSNFASPSPVTDGTNVVFLYGTGDLIAFDPTGKKLWARNLEKDHGQFAYQWTYGASPTLVEGKLIVQVLQRDVPVNGRGRADAPIESFLIAFDPATGKELWRHIRPCEAKAESMEAYSTPIPLVCFDDPGNATIVDGAWRPTIAKLPIKRTQLLIAGGDCVSGHDVATGRELWRWGTWNPTRIGHWRLVPSPVVAGNHIIVAAPKNAPVYGVKFGGQGNLPADALAWTSAEREVSSDVSTPAYYEGRLYVLNSDRKTIARVDPATGKADWVAPLDSRPKYESSPTAADGKLYFQNHAGEVFVVAAAPEFKLLHRTMLGDDGERDTRATIAVAGGELFIRTATKLYCIGQ
jgi:outer membrane protein assembly factor BamB